MGAGTGGNHQGTVENIDEGSDEEPEKSSLYSWLSLHVLYPWSLGTEHLVRPVLPHLHGPLPQVPALLLW